MWCCGGLASPKVIAIVMATLLTSVASAEVKGYLRKSVTAMEIQLTCVGCVGRQRVCWVYVRIGLQLDPEATILDVSCVILELALDVPMWRLATTTR